MKLNRFISNSDYASFKNDTQTNTISVTITSGTVYNPASNILGTATLNIGTINAGIRARGKSSKYSPWVTGSTLYSVQNYSIPSIGPTVLEQSLYCNLERISADAVQLTVAVESGLSGPDQKLEETQTITFVFSTFLSPFD